MGVRALAADFVVMVLLIARTTLTRQAVVSTTCTVYIYKEILHFSIGHCCLVLFNSDKPGEDIKHKVFTSQWVIVPNNDL